MAFINTSFSFFEDTGKKEIRRKFKSKKKAKEAQAKAFKKGSGVSAVKFSLFR